MENLNAEQVKKALECCLTTSEGDCIACGYRGKKDKLFITCTNILMADALALINSQEQRIKELTEKNEGLRADCAKGANALIEEMRRNFTIKADTVRKMQERLKAHLEKPEFPWDSFTVAEEIIDQIAKEMLEGEE